MSNLKCHCGRVIDYKDSYFIRIEPGEAPEVMCEFCVNISN